MDEIEYMFDFETISNQLFIWIDKQLLTEAGMQPYPETASFLKKSADLFKQQDFKWIEQLFLFYKFQGESMNEQSRDGTEYLQKAVSLCEWMGEDSHYLHQVYPDQIDQKRHELEQYHIQLECMIAAGKTAKENSANAYLHSIKRKLNASQFIFHIEQKIALFSYLLAYDKQVLKTELPIVISILYQLKCNNLITEATEQYVLKTLKKEITHYETQIADRWFARKQTELESLINPAVQLLTLVLLLDKKCEEKDVFSSRICRYLSIYDTRYNEQLKDKAYTMLTHESTLDNRIDWKDLLNFNLNAFISQIIYIRIEELNVPIDKQDDKWMQYHNGKNTLTLDKDGFTLSPMFFHNMPTWKGKKDRATLLNNRLFICSFSKPTYLFDNCHTITDFRLYWKQLVGDYPIYQAPQTVQTCVATESPINRKQLNLPEIDSEVTIGVINISNQLIEGIILDKEFRGTKVILPFNQINPCYVCIPHFAELFTINDSFKVRIIEANNEGIKGSLIQTYNEYIYSENLQRKQMPAMLADCEDKKIKWLLITGTTAVTTKQKWIKPHPKDIYKAIFLETNGSSMKALLEIQPNKANITEKSFYIEVWKYLQEFTDYIRQKNSTSGKLLEETQCIKDKNNPFIAALQRLKLEELPAEDAQKHKKKEDVLNQNTDNDTNTIAIIDHQIATELIYCLDALVKNLFNPCEQFNAYNCLQLLCRFTGLDELTRYYEICADYIYSVNTLINKPFKERFTEENIRDFDVLQARMEQLGMEHYEQIFGKSKQIIEILCSLTNQCPDNTLQEKLQDKDETISGLARYFSMMRYLSEDDIELQTLIHKNVNILLGFKEQVKKETEACIPVFFGYEGVEREFKTSAFYHADKDANEDQTVVLARVLTAFMNTDGGTLYIGVSDNGYLLGLQVDLRVTHNDFDAYVLNVNKHIIRILGDTQEDQNRIQEYIRCGFHEYNKGKMVLAFRVPPVNEVISANGKVYTRAASSCILKPEQNIKEFAAIRREAKLDSTPHKPEFPSFYDKENNQYIFTESSEVEKEQLPLPYEPAPEVEVKEELPQTKKKEKTIIEVKTSALRCNPLQKKAELGYTSSYLFTSLFANGKIASSASPKIGVWGDGDGKVIFSYDTEKNEDLLISVYTSGEVGVSNLKKGISLLNTPTAFIGSLDNLLFLSPAAKQDCLLLITEKNGEKRYRIIRLCEFEKSLGIQPKMTTVLTPEKGTYVYADILNEEQMKKLEADKISIDSFDIYNAGRNWEHGSHNPNVDAIAQICNLDY